MILNVLTKNTKKDLSMKTLTLGKRDQYLLVTGILMSKNQVKKEELKVKVLKLKDEVYNEPKTVWQKEKDLAHKYLNKVLDILEEYRY